MNIVFFFWTRSKIWYEIWIHPSQSSSCHPQPGYIILQGFTWQLAVLWRRWVWAVVCVPAPIPGNPAECTVAVHHGSPPALQHTQEKAQWSTECSLTDWIKQHFQLRKVHPNLVGTMKVILTHWPLGSVTLYLKLVIFKLVLRIDILSISSEIALRLMPQDLTCDMSTLVQVMAWCHRATSHYLNQCWTKSLPPYGITSPQWIKSICNTSYSCVITSV